MIAAGAFRCRDAAFNPIGPEKDSAINTYGSFVGSEPRTIPTKSPTEVGRSHG